MNTATTTFSKTSERPAAPSHRLDLMLYIATLEGGGAERVFVRLANHYAAEGRNVALLVNRPDGRSPS